MAAGTAETLVPDGDGERSGVDTAQLYANTHDSAGELRTTEDVDPSYVDTGIMQLQNYLGVSAAAIYAHVRTLRETHTSVLDQDRQPALRAKSLPIGRMAMGRAYTERPTSKGPSVSQAEQTGPELYLG